MGKAHTEGNGDWSGESAWINYFWLFAYGGDHQQTFGDFYTRDLILVRANPYCEYGFARRFRWEWKF